MTTTLFEPMPYTDADRAQWWERFVNQRAAIADHAYAAFAGSLAALGLSPDHIPACDEVNGPLQQLTGWKAYPLPGAMPDRQFFRLMVSRLVLIAERFIDMPAVVNQIARLYRHTLEYGLVKENGRIKIYGARIVSSPAATLHSLSPAARRGIFDLSPVLATPPAPGPVQPQYFVLASIGQLDDIIASLDQLLRSQFG